MAGSRRLLAPCLLAALVLSLASHVFAAEPPPADKSFNQGLQAFKRGNFEDAIASWTAAADAYERQGKPRERMLALTHLAEAYSALGRYRQASATLGIALDLAERSGDSARIASVLSRLGNVHAALGHPDGRALRSADACHEVGFTLVSVALAYEALRGSLPEARDSLSLKAASALREAVTASAGDRRTTSYAWGYLGALYEEEHRYNEALELTRRATFAAQQVSAPESLYRWQWQSGRVLKKLGSVEAALAAYRRAVTTLQSIRPELIRDGAAPGSFRETLGPLYLELVDLLLQQAATRPGSEAVTPLLTEARDVVELFKVAELRDYFRDDCVDLVLAKVTKLDVLAQSAVIVYPIMLPDRTELLVSLRTGLKRVTVPVGADRVTQEVRQLRRKLEKRTTREFLPHAQQLYDWLIRPLEPDLDAARAETLVFVPDGALRTIPMGALHDGQRFLIAKYALRSEEHTSELQ